jgi:inhibitor of cysteine peptidase
VVQKEVKKKTRVYGTVAMLSAIMLVTLIYVFGSSPVIFPPTDTPSVSGMQRFSSYEELKSYLASNTQEDSNYVYGGGPLDSRFFGSSSQALDEAAPSALGGLGFYSNDYSTTNIQVAGVDEADIVKTDGKYLYVATSNDYSSASQNNVYVLKADPQDPRVIAKIALGNSTYVAGLFLSQDSSKLVVIGSQYQLYAYDEAAESPHIMIYPYYSSVNTFLSVYDVSEKDSPVLARNLTLSGSYFNSRMIGDYVYAVISQPAYLVNNDVVLPQVYDNAKASEIAPQRIYYANMSDTYFTFTTFIGLNILNDAQEPTNMTVMMGGTSNMYVSPSNIYVTYPTYNEQGQYTSIFRIHIAGSELTFEAKGSVPGTVLNQYSMDEYNGNFRIATTWQKTTQMNNVYVLDMNMSMVGKLENLAEGESIYSVRFMGDKGYIVTFKQVDPFFMIDLSNAAEPKVAGELKIPGYSSYLHPYDENHVIGLGKENSTVKLSLFDVTNVNAPKEIAKYVIEADYADSEALYDPHAFLFDKDKQLLVVPISAYQYGVVDTSGREEIYSWATTAGFWQGAFVFKLTTSGFTLKGTVTHVENATSYGVDYNQSVERALYIGNTLYTVSNAKVQLNSLDTLALIAEVNLS